MVTPIDGVVQPQDVMLLHFVYSTNLGPISTGNLLASLLKKLAFVFTPSLYSKSLRHATLAFAAGFKPFTQSSVRYDCIQSHSSAAAKEIIKKTPETIDEADLFATFMLAVLFVINHDISSYTVHVKGFMAIMSILSQKSMTKRCRSDLFKFWPVALDVILETSRIYLAPIDLVTEIWHHCSRLIGPQNFLGRVNYLDEFYGSGAKEYAFSQSVWYYSIVARICFRKTVYRQANGGKGMDRTIRSMVSRLKMELDSDEMQDIVKSVRNRRPKFGWEYPDMQEELMIYSTLVYQYCQHLIILLESASILEGADSGRANESAISLLTFAQCPEWLMPITYTLYPRSSAIFLIPESVMDSWFVVNQGNLSGGYNLSNI